MRYVVPLLFSIPIYAIGTVLFKQPELYWIIVAIAFVLYWMITYPKKHKRLVKKQIGKMLEEGDNSSLFGQKTILFNEDTIEIIGENTSEKFAKSSIKNIKEYEDMILLYVSGISAQIIPTRYLNEESKKFLLNEII